MGYVESIFLVGILKKLNKIPERGKNIYHVGYSMGKKNAIEIVQDMAIRFINIDGYSTSAILEELIADLVHENTKENLDRNRFKGNFRRGYISGIRCALRIVKEGM